MEAILLRRGDFCKWQQPRKTCPGRKKTVYPSQEESPMDVLQALRTRMKEKRAQMIELQKELTAVPALAPQNGGTGEWEKAAVLEQWLDASGTGTLRVPSGAGSTGPTGQQAEPHRHPARAQIGQQLLDHVPPGHRPARGGLALGIRPLHARGQRGPPDRPGRGRQPAGAGLIGIRRGLREGGGAHPRADGASALRLRRGNRLGDGRAVSRRRDGPLRETGRRPRARRGLGRRHARSRSRRRASCG